MQAKKALSAEVASRGRQGEQGGAYSGSEVFINGLDYLLIVRPCVNSSPLINSRLQFASCLDRLQTTKYLCMD